MQPFTRLGNEQKFGATILLYLFPYSPLDSFIWVCEAYLFVCEKAKMDEDEVLVNFYDLLL